MKSPVSMSPENRMVSTERTQGPCGTSKSRSGIGVDHVLIVAFSNSLQKQEAPENINVFRSFRWLRGLATPETDIQSKFRSKPPQAYDLLGSSLLWQRAINQNLLIILGATASI